MENPRAPVRASILRAFGAMAHGGNPAGVVLDAERISPGERQRIAREVGLSETAFVERSDCADFRVTFYTPTGEVDLCGHATIAVYALLLHRRLLAPGTYRQELKAGTLPVEVRSDGTIVMDQSPPVYAEEIPLAAIQPAIALAPADLISPALPARIVSTGLRDILLPIATRAALDALTIDFAALAALNAATHTVGLHAFTLDTLSSNSTAYCRNFAPLYGIREESATGSSNGALACYLFHQRHLGDANLSALVFEQGYAMGQPSEIRVSLDVAGDRVARVRVGGKALLVGEKTVTL